MTLTAAQAQALCRKILAEAKLGDVRVRIRSGQRGNARFGASQPTTSGDVETLDIAVTAAEGGRHATVTGNRTDPASLRELVAQAEALAKLAPVDPEHMGPLGKQTFLRPKARDAKLAGMGSPGRAPIVKDAIVAGRDKGTVVSGFLEHAERSVAVADRAGLFGHHTDTFVALSCTCRTDDGSGSGRASFVGHSLRGLDARAMAARAADIAVRSQKPQAIDPGRYVVVLAPEAVAELLDFFVDAMGARRAAEGRSYFAGKDGATRIGEKLFDERVRMWSDPADVANPASPIAEDGRPQGKVTWIDNGVLKALTTTRFWANKSGLPSVPRPSSIHVAGGTGDLDALVAGVERGVLVTRFWYNRMVEPRTILATGLTRDGTFMIEKGKLVRPVKNMRYNESPVTLLKNVVALGEPRRAAVGDDTVWVVPPMVVADFNFESVSDAV